MTDLKLSEGQITSKYFKKMMLILVLTSITLSAFIVAIASIHLKGSFLLLIFFGLVVVMLVSNYILLWIIRVWVIKPMLKDMQIEKCAYRKDKLTGLCRREVLEERKVWYENDYESIGILYVDINNLKTINDQFGHLAGDELILKVAESIKALRTEYSDLDHFRFGGDEFIIVIKDATEYKCRQLSITLTESINAIVLRRARGHQAQAAIGFSYSNNEINFPLLLDIADKDMYRNKAIMKAEG